MKLLYIFCFFTFMLNTQLKAQEAANTIIIGSQKWMENNLDVNTFVNGDTILEAKTHEEWRNANKLGKPVWCFYNNDSSLSKQYGRIYNWYSIIDKRGLAPKGFHIPNKSEWETFVKSIGGNKQATKIKSLIGWKESERITNTTNFSAVPGGFRLGDGSFYGIQQNGALWSTSGADGDVKSAYYFDIDGNNAKVSFGDKSYGLYVRCIKN